MYEIDLAVAFKLFSRELDVLGEINDWVLW